MYLNKTMSVIGVILGVNIYVLLMGFYHKAFSHKHGSKKALLLGNVIILAVVALGFLLFYYR